MVVAAFGARTKGVLAAFILPSKHRVGDALLRSAHCAISIHVRVVGTRFLELVSPSSRPGPWLRAYIYPNAFRAAAAPQLRDHRSALSLLGHLLSKSGVTSLRWSIVSRKAWVQRCKRTPAPLVALRDTCQTLCAVTEPYLSPFGSRFTKCDTCLCSYHGSWMRLSLLLSD